MRSIIFYLSYPYYFCIFVKKVFVFLLLAAFAVQSFNNTVIVVSFYINQKKIASTLCENRYRPMLHCDGKCVLAKKIKQEESRNNQNPERKMENKNEVISSKSFFPLLTTIVCKRDIFFPPYHFGNAIKIPHSIFHPPNPVV
jgi:hypothetical protein